MWFMLDTTSASRLQSRIHSEIPISKDMGIRVLGLEEGRVILEAPLEPNTNHKSTAFGGSINSIAVLSCWALLSTALEGTSHEVDYIVVQDSRINYVSPVDSDFQAIATWPSAEARDQFFSTLVRKGLGRATLRSVVKAGDRICAEFEGRFVASTKTR